MTANIDAYIMDQDEKYQPILKRIREMIHTSIPEIEERMSWGMPTFYYRENIIHFAVNKNHLGIYPGSEVIEYFDDALKDYKTSKGAVQFPWNSDIPYDLIQSIIDYRAEAVWISPYELFLQRLSSPARSALQYAGIDSFEKLASLREKDILALHGIGKASLPMMRKALEEQGMSFSV